MKPNSSPLITNFVKMKKFKLLVCILFSLSLFIGCKKDEVAEQEKDNVFTPRILGGDIAALFPTSDSPELIDVGTEIDFSQVQFTPSGKVSVVWKVNNVEVATGEKYKYKATTAGESRIKVEATYNGTTVSRYKDVIVLGPSTGTFTPKTYTKVVMPYVSATASILQIRNNIRWDKVTHVALKGATVNVAGELTFTDYTTSRRGEYLLQKAHAEGVSVLLGISGTLSGDGWNVYNSNDFGARLANATSREAIATSLANFVTTNKLDGVEVRMSDVGNDVEATFQANIQALGAFVDRLRALLGAGKIITVSVASPTLTRATGAYSTWVVSKYVPAHFNNANWINVRAYSQSGYWGGTNVIGQPSSYELMEAGVNYWKARVPVNKLVVGMSALGIRHLQTSTINGNLVNNGWTNTFFDFMPYRDIIAQDATASTKDNSTAIARGVYYNGIPTITRKVQLLKTENFLGAYLWAAENDTVDEATSLLGTISKTIQ